MTRGLRASLWNGKAFQPGWLTWAGGTITGLGWGEVPRGLGRELQDLGQSRIIPGFVDTLLHGFAGVDCGEGSPADLDRMTRALAATGVTTALAGFYPMKDEDAKAASRRWNRWRAMRGRARTRIPGWHSEGPFLARSMRGALPAAAIRRPHPSAADSFAEACGGWLKLCTMAPELPGAFEAADALRAYGVIPSIGHCEAGFLHCEAFSAGEDVAMTHLGNRMQPMTAREPGPIGFAMAGGARWVAVIPDMVHVAPEVLQLWVRTPALRTRLMACSDNLSHAGLPAEAFRAGGRRLRRSGAVALDSQDGLAGTLDSLPEMLLRLVRDGYLDLAQALRVGCTNPGTLLGDCGWLEVGLRADLAMLEDSKRVGAVWVGGRRVQGSG